MKHFHHEVRIEAPVEHVWKFYCDTTHWQDWMPRARCSQFSGPLDQVGTTYVGGMRLMGFEMKANYEIVEVEPQRLIHERSDYGPMDNYMRFEPDDELPSKMPGFIQDLVAKGWMERNMHQTLADFKALAETTVPAHA